MTVVMGILNVTPDSFSDGGDYPILEAAVARGIELRDLGADLVDVGGESTRPGAERVTAEEEQRRVVPVIRALTDAGVPVSVDTMRAATAAAAIAAGASVVNDVSGGLADADMYGVIAASDVPYVAMHWRGHSRAMDDLAGYVDVVAEVRSELAARLDAMDAAGIDLDRVTIDPGLGFAKRAEHNWQLLARLDELAGLGRPILVGASRKRFLAVPGGDDPRDRDLASAVVAALAASAGVWGLRVHDVASTIAALRVWGAWQNGRST